MTRRAVRRVTAVIGTLAAAAGVAVATADSAAASLAIFVPR